jgi:flavin-dependent dehydrogenase
LYDVAVVGAGPAGSTAARELSIKGYRVLLIDKAGFPRNKTCGGLISLKTINALDYEITSKVIENRITEVLLFGHDLKSIKVASGTLLGCTCQRIHFDSFLMEKAKKSGAVFRDNCELKSIENQDKSMIIKTNRGNFKTRYVIGADGVFSKTAKVTSLRKKWSKWQLGITLSVNIPLKGNELFDATRLNSFVSLSWEDSAGVSHSNSISMWVSVVLLLKPQRHCVFLMIC